jgi:hypothetical protein
VDATVLHIQQSLAMVLFYGWSIIPYNDVKCGLTPREEHRLRVSVNIGPEIEEVEGGWIRVHNKIHNLYTSLNWDDQIKMRNVYKILIRKPEGKRSVGGLSHRWKENIRMDLLKIEWEFVDWIHLAQDSDQWQTLVNMVMNLWVP